MRKTKTTIPTNPREQDAPVLQAGGSNFDILRQKTFHNRSRAVVVNMIELCLGFRTNHTLGFLRYCIFNTITQNQSRSRIANAERNNVPAYSEVGNDDQAFEIILKTVIRQRIVTVMQSGEHVLSQLIRQTDFQPLTITRLRLECTGCDRFRIIGKGRIVIQVVIVVQDYLL